MVKAKKTAVKKTATKRTKTSAQMHEIVDFSPENSYQASTDAFPKAPPSPMKWGVLIVGLLLVVGVYAGSKGYIVAATVNGVPVFRWDIVSVMTARYGQQTLESMISEKLIADAAKKQGVVISQKDIDAKTNEVVKSLGPNVKLEDLLKYQGMNKSDFEHQISLQLTVEKILGKDVAVTDSEVEEFISKNKETMVATEGAAMNGEAREALMSQKINEKIQPWFAKLKETAKVVRLMK